MMREAILSGLIGLVIGSLLAVIIGAAIGYMGARRYRRRQPAVPVIAGKLTSEENEAAYEAACAIILAGGSPDAAVKAGNQAVLALRKTKAEDWLRMQGGA